MSEYIYIHSEPFQKAQRYDFAACADYSFIEGWRAFRQTSRHKILAALAEYKTGNEVILTSIPGAVSVYDLLKTDKDLWLLIKKFEIFGKLYAFYQVDGTRHPQSASAPLSAYVAFVDSLLRRARLEECYQYYSTALKVMDALCVMPVGSVDANSAREIVRLIDEENDLLSHLEEAVYGS